MVILGFVSSRVARREKEGTGGDGPGEGARNSKESRERKRRDPLGEGLGRIRKYLSFSVTVIIYPSFYSMGTFLRFGFLQVFLIFLIIKT